MFELTFLGCSGGPMEGSTCALLVKPATSSYLTLKPGELLCIDGGSGLASLTETIYHEQRTSQPYSKTIELLASQTNIKSPQDICEAVVTTPFAEIQGSPFYEARKIFSCLSNYLITHPHLDHIAGLVVNSSGFDAENPKSVYGSEVCMSALSAHIFNNIIWPDLPQHKLLSLNSVNYEHPFSPSHGVYSVTMFELSHGVNYKSSAFLINYKPADARDNASADQEHMLLVFGDFESDRVSGASTNIHVWQQVAPLVARGQLRGIVVECSHGDSLNDSLLFGHLKSSDLIHELATFKELIEAEGGSINGLHVVVNHVKDLDSDVRLQILKELRDGASLHQLDIKISLPLSGVSLVI
ncbi:hypothetical protein DIURU_003495 [Diutina rugosa]|uniref:3',5'-cyclic-nucleotide phosphodiesterase n=1 Tax=Diutina rugosa TaxID=5481 RepID=A0A642UQE4_DIURU|nr:uncharacterized protein DIURU_003495 [Diutina rugosa]KAA8901125.1 hypothetical protein DIURU_003495 [Diutina rugosa]